MIRLLARSVFSKYIAQRKRNGANHHTQSTSTSTARDNGVLHASSSILKHSKEDELYGWFVLATLHHGRFLTMISPSMHTSSLGSTTESFLTSLGIRNYFHSTRRAKKNRMLVPTEGHITNPNQHEIVEDRIDGEAIDMADGFLARGT